MGCISTIKLYSVDQGVSIPSCGDLPARPVTQIRTGRQFYKEIACGVVGAVTIASNEEADDRSTALGASSEPRLVMINRLNIAFADLKKVGQLFGVISEGVAWEELSGQINKIRRYGSALEILIDPAKALPEGIR